MIELCPDKQVKVDLIWNHSVFAYVNITFKSHIDHINDLWLSFTK